MGCLLQNASVLPRAQTLPEKNAYNSAKSQSDSLQVELKEARDECNDCGINYENNRKTLLLNFARLLSEPRLDFEKESHHHSWAGSNPMFLGVVKIEETDLRVLNILKEPTELVIPIPTDSAITIDNDDENEALQTEAEYLTARLWTSVRPARGLHSKT